MVVHAKYKGLRGYFNGFQQSLISVEEATHFLPTRSLGTPQVEAPHSVFADGVALGSSPVVHTVVADQDPSTSADYRHPLVILGVSWEMVLEVLHRRG